MLILLLNQKSGYVPPVVSVVVSPSTLTLIPNSPAVLVSVTNGTPGNNVTLSPAAGFPAGLVNIANVGPSLVPTGGGTIYFSVQLASTGQGGYVNPSTALTATDGVTTATLAVSVNPTVTNQFSPAAPATAASLISQVYSRTNENSSSVPQTTVQSFLNTAMIEVAQALVPTRLYNTIQVPPQQNIIVLPNDIQEIIGLSWSSPTGPTATGSLVYRLTQMDISTMMDFSGGQPGTGFGNPIAFAIVSDSSGPGGGNLTIQLYPAANGGYLNIYYYSRPLPFIDTASSTTNLDAQSIEPVVLWTCARVCEARERTSDADRFIQQYTTVLQNYNDYIARRNRPKTGIVRDVTNMGATGAPPWLP